MSTNLSSPLHESWPRRRFVRDSLLAIPVLALAARLRAATGPRPTIGLSQYSLRTLFRSGALDPLDYPAFAREKFGLTSIDLWEGGLPPERLDDRDYLARLRRTATDNGSDLFLLMAGVVDATAETAAERQAAVTAHFPSVERAAALGCTYLRVFIKAPDLEREAALERCLQPLSILADRCRDRGLVMVIEPGSSKLSMLGGFLADIAVRLNHPQCRLMPDFGKLKDNVYEGTRLMMPHTAVVSAKTFDFDEAGNQIRFDYDRLFRIIADAGFSGIVAIEWEGKQLDPVAGVTASHRLLQRVLARP